MVTYLTQLLTGWKCNCFVNACYCCNCLSVPLLEFGVTSPALSGTGWAVRLLFYVIRHLPPTTVLAASTQILWMIIALRNHHSHYKKNGIIYMFSSYLARTEKIEEIVTLNTLMKPIFN